MAGKNESVGKTLLVAFLVCVVCGVVERVVVTVVDVGVVDGDVVD